jgi:hypothetical protein
MSAAVPAVTGPPSAVHASNARPACVTSSSSPSAVRIAAGERLDRRGELLGAAADVTDQDDRRHVRRR